MKQGFKACFSTNLAKGQGVVVLLRRFTGMPINAVQVSFPHAAPADTSGAAVLTGVP